MLTRIGYTSLFAVAALFLVALVSQAQAMVSQFDFPSQPLETALRALGSQTHTNVLFDPPLVEGRYAPTLKAELTLDQAFTKLLAGTGLRHRFLDDKTVMVISATTTPPASKPTTNASGFAVIRVAQLDTTPGSAQISTEGRNAQNAENKDSEVSSVTSENQLEEIMVTAERRTSTVQRTAASIAVRAGDELQRQGRTTLNQILEDVTGVTGVMFPGQVGANTSSPELKIAIRGIRSNEGTGGLAPPSTTALYVDGVYGGASGNYDLDRVEVLRGPQGTLYGRSATGGVVSIYTRNPDLKAFSIGGQVEAGSYDLRHYTGIVNVPIVSDTFALRVAGDHYERDGYYSREGGAVNTDSFRAKLLFQPTDDLSFLLGYSLQRNTPSNGGLTIRLTPTIGQYVYDRSTPVGKGLNKFSIYSAQLDWNLGGARLTYLGAIRDYEQNSTGYTIGPGGGILASRAIDPDNRSTSNELRVNFGNEGSFVAQVGAIYYENKSRDYSSTTSWVSSGALLTGRNQQRDLKEFGAYGEGTVWLTDSSRLTAGLRSDQTKIDTIFRYRSNRNRYCNTPVLPSPAGCVSAATNGPQSGFPELIDSTNITPDNGGSATFNSTNYKLRFEYDVAPENMIYAMVSTGAVPGDIQIASSIPAFAYKYESESLTAFEIGSKNRFFNNRLQANLSLYHYDYDGFQTVITPNPANTTEQYFVNVPAKMFGGELEMIGRVTSRDTITANLSYIQPRYSNPDGIILQRPAPLAPIPFTDIAYGNTIANIIREQANVSYEHRFDFFAGSNLNFRASVRYQGAYQARSISRSLYNAGGYDYLTIPAATIGNLSFDWNSANDHLGVTAYVRNVTDERVPSDILLQAITPTAVTGSLTEEFMEPRTFGVLARVRW